MKQNLLKLLAVVFAFALIASACGDDDDSSSEGDDSSSEGDDAAEDDMDGDLAGTTVTVFSSIRDVEAERLEAAWADFEEETGVDIVHEPSAEFETQLQVRVEGGNPPDLAFVPQPGLLATLVAGGSVVPLSDLESYVEESHIPGLSFAGTIDGTFYAPPFGTNVKSFVWYNPTQFEADGYAVPTTWEEMIALSDQIVADGGKPWCAGIESGGATGWPATDWVEDAMLRFAGPDAYDQWVVHEIPFNDPQVRTAVDAVDSILRNEDYMAGGVQSVAVTAFQDGGLGILDGSCYMHRQASFYGNQFPEGTEKGAEGDVNAFFFPFPEGSEFPEIMLVGGELITAFDDRPEVLAVAEYLTGDVYANNRIAGGNWLSSNLGADYSVLTDELEILFAEQLFATEGGVRFDGADFMPAAVGSGTFWTEMTAWIGTGKDTGSVLDAIEDSWPS